MRLKIVVDERGKVVAAMMNPPEDGSAGILPSSLGHVYHEIDLPPTEQTRPLHEIVSRIKIGPHGKPHLP